MLLELLDTLLLAVFETVERLFLVVEFLVVVRVEGERIELSTAVGAAR